MLVLPKVRRHRDRATRDAGHDARFVDGSDERKKKSLVDYEVRSALAEEGCPVCRLLRGADRRYFLWFFIESYSEYHTLAALARSLGFCLAHGTQALSYGGRGALAGVHDLAIQSLRRIWSTEKTRAEWEHTVSRRGGDLPPCPACRSRADRESNHLHFLAWHLAGEPDGGRYGKPALLCVTHLRKIAPLLRNDAFARLIRVHEAGIAEHSRSRPSGATGLALGAGFEFAASPLPVPSPSGRRGARIDQIDCLERDLRDGDGCFACAHLRRAWCDWALWLDDAAATDDIWDLLPTCSEHLWAMLRGAGPRLRERLEARAFELASDAATRAGRFLRANGACERARPNGLAAAAVFRKLAPVRAARQSLALERHCPVCAQLGTAVDRVLTLHFALLGRPQHRNLYENGYGLCMRHFARAVALGPDPAVLDCLRRVQSARLGQLEWEIAEYSRKSAWHNRAEPRGIERNAAVRAVRWFSGSLEPAPVSGETAGSGLV